MKKIENNLEKILVIGFLVFAVALGWAVKKQDEQFQAGVQAKIEEKNARTVVAYQVADDGAMQITFANGEGYYFEDLMEVVDHMDEIENYNFVLELDECYDGHPSAVKTKLIALQVVLLGQAC